ncbi:MAG: hypothetical protein KC646_07635 [Candidatus Cloacimonetes bacterium]|nr:hypothetical protein [Candidatus Cloacimonadota bacterium]
MKNWIKIVLGVCILSCSNFALDESVADMILRITGSSNQGFQSKLETGLEMGTIEESDLEEIITNAHENSDSEGEGVDKNTKSQGGEVYGKKYVLGIQQVSNCFHQLSKYTKKKKLATVGKKYKKYFTKFGKPIKIENEDGENSLSNNPFAKTKLSTIMMDYSKCLYSLSVIKKKYAKSGASQKEQTSTSKDSTDETQDLPVDSEATEE